MFHKPTPFFLYPGGGPRHVKAPPLSVRPWIFLGGVDARDATKRNGIGDSVAAQTVGAMDTARHLARCVQAGITLLKMSITWAWGLIRIPPMVWWMAGHWATA